MATRRASAQTVYDSAIQVHQLLCRLRRDVMSTLSLCELQEDSQQTQGRSFMIVLEQQIGCQQDLIHWVVYLPIDQARLP